MAKYSDIKGFTVQTLASDTTATGIAGATWASGGALPQGISWGGSKGAGTQTAALTAAGSAAPGAIANAYTYNGSSWTAVNSLNTARGSAAMRGAQTSAIAVGGSAALNNVEKWDGTNWTETGEIEAAQTAWDALSAEEQARSSRPVVYNLP